MDCEGLDCEGLDWEGWTVKEWTVKDWTFVFDHFILLSDYATLKQNSPRKVSNFQPKHLTRFEPSCST